MMQRQFFLTMERLIGVLSGPEWDKLKDDTQLKILEFVKKNNEAVLKMSSVNQKSREQLAEARKTIGEMREWLNEQEKGHSFQIVDGAYKIRVKKSSIVALPSWTIDTQSLNDTNLRTGVIFYRSGQWILRRQVHDDYHDSVQVDVYRINTVGELKEILKSDKPSVERFNIESLDHLDHLRGRLRRDHFDEESTDPMINPHIYIWLVTKFIISTNKGSGDRKFRFFQIDEGNWEFYMSSSREGISLRGTIVFKADYKMDIWYEWNGLGSTCSGYIENIRQGRVKHMENWRIADWNRKWPYYVR